MIYKVRAPRQRHPSRCGSRELFSRVRRSIYCISLTVSRNRQINKCWFGFLLNPRALCFIFNFQEQRRCPLTLTLNYYFDRLCALCFTNICVLLPNHIGLQSYYQTSSALREQIWYDHSGVWQYDPRWLYSTLCLLALKYAKCSTQKRQLLTGLY